MSVDCATLREWLHERYDGELPAYGEAPYDQHLSECAACRTAADRLGALVAALDSDRVPVLPRFRASVMASLPAAAWEAKRPRAWAAALAVMAALLLAAVGLGLLGAAAETPAGLGAAGALARLLGEAVVAGAGLTTASWRGLRLTLAEIWSGSPAALLLLGVVVAALNLLLWQLVRGPGAGTAKVASRLHR